MALAIARTVPAKRATGFPLARRICDIGFALVIGALLALPFLLLLGVVLVVDGRPLFYGSSRMQTPRRAFTLWKLRTLRPSNLQESASGGHLDARLTRLGGFLRRSHLDELPQLWNLLRGDITLIGPRPPLPAYVAEHPAIFARVLRDRPGLTGLATLVIRAHEERVLSPCTTPDETARVYARRIVARKARLDLIYQRRCCLRLDLAILARTMADLFHRFVT